MEMRSLRPSARGMTLIELLVALAISVVVMSVVIFAYRSLTRSESRQFSRSQAQAQADGIIDFIREDLENLFHPAGDKACEIDLENSGTNLIRLAFCRWEPGLPGYGILTNRAERVEFKFAPIDGKQTLIRVREPLTGPESLLPAITNWSGHRWPRLQVQLFDGETWQTNWPDDKAARAMAARILLWQDDKAEPFQEAMIIIPSSISVTSSVPRTTQSALP